MHYVWHENLFYLSRFSTEHKLFPAPPPNKKPQQKKPKVNTSALGKIMVQKMYWANFKWGRKLKGKKSSFIHVTIIDL